MVEPIEKFEKELEDFLRQLDSSSGGELSKHIDGEFEYDRFLGAVIEKLDSPDYIVHFDDRSKEEEVLLVWELSRCRTIFLRFVNVDYKIAKDISIVFYTK